MIRRQIQSLIVIIIITLSCKNRTPDGQITNITSNLKVTFENSEEYKFNDAEKEEIRKIAIKADKELRTLLPGLNKNLVLKSKPVPFDLGIVGGVTGRANTPNEVIAEISFKYEGGVIAAVNQSLSGHIYHEFHHVWKGWTLSENKFDKGIYIAAINEGLADVFSKTYTGHFLDIGSQSDDIKGWTKEVLKLPKDADYNRWMNQHEDGRLAIGYRVGTFIVENAMKNSEMTILELSNLTPNEILKLSRLEEK
ncbi:DUF2268 domain-containing putative Zn-dependent protease [Aquimarina algiphila]|uniref:DUF2268 domain-containing putative Zn-dependent protease n=1 Tax=Aquimarina algiphila TaxID=2047982 RepID=UPI002491B54D|nr:DUF2268 domain-containing putative Zn-dependent protease [Aquimarina algiphila]